MEQWYAVHKYETGQLLSITTVVADVLPVDCTATQLPVDPLAHGLVWEANTRSFIGVQPEPLVDRLQDLLQSPRYSDFMMMWNSLLPAQRQALRNALIRLLGSRRFRVEDEPVDIDA